MNAKLDLNFKIAPNAFDSMYVPQAEGNVENIVPILCIVHPE